MKRAILILIAGLLLILGQAGYALDTDLPTLTMSPAALPAYVQANPSVSGTASDATTGISAVRGAIFYFDESGQAYFWDGSSSWVTSDYLTFAVTTTGSLNTPGAIVSWNYTFPTLTNGRTYYYVFLAKDQANNFSAAQARTTICDSSNPILGSQFPLTSSENYTRFGAGQFFINGVSWSDLCIKGVAIDPSGSGQIDRVELTISETGGKYYNGDADSWQTTSCSFNALRSITISGKDKAITDIIKANTVPIAAPLPINASTIGMIPAALEYKGIPSNTARGTDHQWRDPITRAKKLSGT